MNITHLVDQELQIRRELINDQMFCCWCGDLIHLDDKLVLIDLAFPEVKVKMHSECGRRILTFILFVD